MGKVTEEMLEAGYRAYWAQGVVSGLVCADVCLRAAYLAMRAARPRKAKAKRPVADEVAVANAIRKAGYALDTPIPLDGYLCMARAAITAMGAAAVPEEATEAMAEAGLTAYYDRAAWLGNNLGAMADAYRAMLAAGMQPEAAPDAAEGDGR